MTVNELKQVLEEDMKIGIEYYNVNDKDDCVGFQMCNAVSEIANHHLEHEVSKMYVHESNRLMIRIEVDVESED